MGFRRQIPIGAELQKAGGTHFRVWATTASSVGIRVADNPGLTENAITVDLESEENNYFSGHIPEAKAGQFYKISLGSMLFPDPAARAQHGGPHGASVIVDPESYIWQDQNWGGVSRDTHVIYEMHVGTFTLEGT
jgi:maltooligosyltrehalose trehalohydrolase